RHTALAITSLTGHLLVPPPRHLVSGRGLPRETEAGVLRPVIEYRLLVAGIVRPLGGVARVSIEEDPGHRVFRVEVPGRREEPEPIALDRPAERRVDVPRLDELVDLSKAQGPLFVTEVIALPAVTGIVEEHGSAVAVASLPRDQVHLWTTGSRLAEAAGDLKRDFLRAADLGHVPGHPHSKPTGTQPVDLDLALVASTAVRLKDAERVTLHAADVRPLRADPRHQHGDRSVPPAARNAGEDCVVDRPHRRRALHVDNRALAGNSDRFRDGGDA